ncbi:hypothetical protein [Aquiflexum sp.]|uniref:hypothetical protein n=1 Tax=Aquiflexum sp. TaxID=1872584 RepID=UPI00359390ED
MKKHIKILTTLFLVFTSIMGYGQDTPRFDIVSYNAPADWTKDTGNSFVAYTLSDITSKEYARIIIFKSLPGSGNVNSDFDIEWKELVQLNYSPENFTNTGVSDYKDGWVSKIGVAPFKFQNENHAALLLTQVKSKTKMSFVFITNTTKYETVFEDFASSLDFGGGQAIKTQENKPQQTAPPFKNQTTGSKSEPENQPAASQSSGFNYTTSNFDDGWVASIQPDWVLVQKGETKVYLFFVLPYQSENFDGTGVRDRDFYWDNHIAPLFKTSSKSYQDGAEFVSSMQPKYVEGWGVDPQTGQRRFIGMFLTVAPNSAMLTVANSAIEEGHRQNFPKAAHNWDSDLEKMSRYNKFAIGPNDLNGTWQSGGSQMAQWYNSVTGAYAGATFAASSATFSFSGNSYTSIHNGATGAVGAMNAFQQEYKGNATTTNWNITMTNRYQGKTQQFDAHFQAVRDGRLLYLNDRSGGEYTLVKIK